MSNLSNYIRLIFLRKKNTNAQSFETIIWKTETLANRYINIIKNYNQIPLPLPQTLLVKENHIRFFYSDSLDVMHNCFFCPSYTEMSSSVLNTVIFVL